MLAVVLRQTMLRKPSTAYLPVQKGEKCYFKKAQLSVCHLDTPTLHTLWE